MMKKYAVVGLGQFGRELVLSLVKLGAEVMAIDVVMEHLEEIKDLVSRAVCLDVLDEAALAGVGIQDVDEAVVSIGQDLATSVLATALLRKLGVKRIIGRATSDLHAQVLKAVGADSVVNPEKEMAATLAGRLHSPHLRTRIHLDLDHRIIEVAASREQWGRSLKELNFRARYLLNVIAIRKRLARGGRDGEILFDYKVNDLPAGDDVIEEGDMLILLGSDDAIARFGISTETGS